MRLIRMTTLAPALLVAALSLPIVAVAQTTDKPAATSPSEAHKQRVEERIADMYATLHIAPTQEAVWNDFAQVMLDNAQAMDTLLAKHATDPSTRSAEDIMASYAAMAQQHAQNVQKLSAAFHTLYNNLTSEQRKAADELFRTNALQRVAK